MEPMLYLPRKELRAVWTGIRHSVGAAGATRRGQMHDSSPTTALSPSSANGAISSGILTSAALHSYRTPCPFLYINSVSKHFRITRSCVGAIVNLHIRSNGHA